MLQAIGKWGEIGTTGFDWSLQITSNLGDRDLPGAEAGRGFLYAA